MPDFDADQDKVLMEKLLFKIEERTKGDFTPAEIVAIRRLIRLLVTLDSLGSVGKFVKSILGWLTVVIVSWLAFKNGMAEWITSLIR